MTEPGAVQLRPPAIDANLGSRYTGETPAGGEVAVMKFVLTYTIRDGGSLSEREAAAKRGLQLLGKWQPSIEFKEWVDRVDGEGGFVVFESDDAATITKDVSIWAPMFRFELYPVMDALEGTPIQQEAVDFRDSIA